MNQFESFEIYEWLVEDYYEHLTGKDLPDGLNRPLWGCFTAKKPYWQVAEELAKTYN